MVKTLNVDQIRTLLFLGTVTLDDGTILVGPKAVRFMSNTEGITVKF